MAIVLLHINLILAWWMVVHADYPDDDEWMSEEINATIRNIADCRSMMEWRGLFHLITRNFIFLHI